MHIIIVSRGTNYDIVESTISKNWNVKGGQKRPLILGRSGTQYVAMVIKLLGCYYSGAHLVESYCKESKILDSNWLRCLL